MLRLQFSLIFAVAVLVGCETDQEWMKKTLKSYFSQTRHHIINAAYKQKAMNFIKDQFKEYGLDTYSDTFESVNGKHGTNVIGILKGNNFKKTGGVIVGVGAHYDTVRNTPGVNDNGAAVVAMLQAAKNVASKPNRINTVVFVAFDLKEWKNNDSFPDTACEDNGLCGSKHFFSHWLPVFWKSQPTVGGVIIMDNIMNFDETRDSQDLPGRDQLLQLFPTAVQHVEKDGNKGNFLAVIGRPADSKLMSTFVEQYKLQGQPKYKIEEFNLTPLNEKRTTKEDIKRFEIFTESDHTSLWMSGTPAIFLTDTGDLRGYMKNCFHKPCDKMDKVTNTMIQFATKTSKAVAATINQLSPNAGQRLVPEVILFLSLILATQLV